MQTFLLLAPLLLPCRLEAPTDLEWAGKFWAEASIEGRDRIAEEWLLSEPEFQSAYDALSKGRVYPKDAPSGYILRKRTGSGGLVHPYLILVPENYTPEHKWPMRLELHGGMGAEEWDPDKAEWAGGWNKTGGGLVVLPAGWRDSMWWHASQAENIEAILRDVSANWNVDEDRIVAVGNSDGGAALFFLAMRMPDRFAGYAGYVAPPDRLVRADFEPDGQMHIDNLARQRFHLGFGERDIKVPIKHLRKYMELFESVGALLDWYVLEGQGHSLKISDERHQQFLKFVYGIRRKALPDELSWSTERTDRYARRSWLRIDKLSPSTGRTKVDTSRLLPRWGTSIQLRGKTVPRVPFGTVHLKRSANEISVTTSGVEGFTLLISPAQFDLDLPLTLKVNGSLVRNEIPKPSVKTMLHWAARDDDRTKLFASAWSQ